jgi:hypothetical protein
MRQSPSVFAEPTLPNDGPISTTPKDPTIREKFNTYRFADHKGKVIDLLMRVTRVSVETMKIVEAMKSAKRT